MGTAASVLSLRLRYIGLIISASVTIAIQSADHCRRRRYPKKIVPRKYPETKRKLI
jgi:hypothetical protein